MAVVPALRVDRETEERFRQGERDAFSVVYDTHAAAIQALVGRFFARAFEREEAVQEVWLHVHRVAGSFDAGRGQLLPWLRAIASNRCKELLRARGRRPDARFELEDGEDATQPSPEEVARASRLREAVAAFEATLPAVEAAVFRLSLVEEHSLDETARRTGMSVRQCKYLRKKLLLRAAAEPALRAALGEVGAP